jgi:putative endonuclease
MFYLYIIYSETADRYYVGHSADPEKRLLEHNSDPRSTFTHKYRPWILKASFPVSDQRSIALKVERYIKKMKSRKLIENLIRSENVSEIIAQAVRVPTRRD